MKKSVFAKVFLIGAFAVVAGCAKVDGPNIPSEACPNLAKTAPALVQKHAKKRLVCLDLDATLCQHRTIPPPENLAALRELEKRYKCIMVGAGNAPRIYKQMGNYPIDILANYGMQESKMIDGKFTIVRQVTNSVDRAFFKEKTDYLRQKYGYTNYWGNSVEFHASGMAQYGRCGGYGGQKLLLTHHELSHEWCVCGIECIVFHPLTHGVVSECFGQFFRGLPFGHFREVGIDACLASDKL